MGKDAEDDEEEEPLGLLPKSPLKNSPILSDKLFLLVVEGERETVCSPRFAAAAPWAPSLLSLDPGIPPIGPGPSPLVGLTIFPPNIFFNFKNKL